MLHKVVYAVLVFFILLSFRQCNKNNRLENQAESNTKMIEALTDSVKYSTDKFNRVVAEKRVIETSARDLEKVNKLLTTNQQKLLKEAKPVKHLKAGIQLRESIKVDSATVIENDKTVLIEETKKGTIVKIVNSNERVTTEEIDAIFIPRKKKIGERKIVKIGLFVLGLAAGVALSR
jgi:hypothetical protein